MSDDITSKTVSALLDIQAVTANTNGPAVSVAGLQGMVDVIASVGTPGNGTGTISFQLQTSADGTTNWQNVGPVLAAFSTASGIVAANLNPVAASNTSELSRQWAERAHRSRHAFWRSALRSTSNEFEL